MRVTTVILRDCQREPRLILSTNPSSEESAFGLYLVAHLVLQDVSNIVDHFCQRYHAKHCSIDEKRSIAEVIATFDPTWGRSIRGP